mgnify:CR=1 FL=1
MNSKITKHVIGADADHVIPKLEDSGLNQQQ